MDNMTFCVAGIKKESQMALVQHEDEQIIFIFCVNYPYTIIKSACMAWKALLHYKQTFQ